MFGNLNPPSGGGKNYLKIESGSKVRGLVIGEPVEFYKEFSDQKKWRFQVNFIVKENGAFTAKILEQGAMVFNQLKSLEDDGWDLERNIVVISKRGSGMNTEYSVNVDPKGGLTDEALDKIRAIELHNLGPKDNGSHVSEPQSETEDPF